MNGEWNAVLSLATSNGAVAVGDDELTDEVIKTILRQQYLETVASRGSSCKDEVVDILATLQKLVPAEEFRSLTLCLEVNDIHSIPRFAQWSVAVGRRFVIRMLPSCPAMQNSYQSTGNVNKEIGIPLPERRERSERVERNNNRFDSQERSDRHQDKDSLSRDASARRRLSAPFTGNNRDVSRDRMLRKGSSEVFTPMLMLTPQQVADQEQKEIKELNRRVAESESREPERLPDQLLHTEALSREQSVRQEDATENFVVAHGHTSESPTLQSVAPVRGDTPDDQDSVFQRERNLEYERYQEGRENVELDSTAVASQAAPHREEDIEKEHEIEMEQQIDRERVQTEEQERIAEEENLRKAQEEERQQRVYREENERALLEEIREQEDVRREHQEAEELRLKQEEEERQREAELFRKQEEREEAERARIEQEERLAEFERQQREEQARRAEEQRQQQERTMIF